VKIGRFQSRHESRFWGVVEHLDDGSVVVARLRDTFAEWAPRLSMAGTLDDSLVSGRQRFAELRLLAPVEPGARVFGTGINYGSHLLDARNPAHRHPPTPPGYIKLDSTIVDPGGEIRYPATTDTLDYEVELVAVVARHLAPGEARVAALLGYTIGNDVCHRDVGPREPGTPPATDLYSRKTMDQTAPIGPWITTLAELGGLGQPCLRISQSINGEPRQDDTTANMHLQIEQILAWVNDRNRLRPGDVLFTGTVGGVGLLTNQFLRPGDRLEARIEGIGTLSNVVGARIGPQ
jgi:2-keto-4-pentenoate hydratase/2-oxohepta-3-ene-1,7-dioic acid hydratase in catechol pathway